MLDMVIAILLVLFVGALCFAIVAAFCQTIQLDSQRYSQASNASVFVANLIDWEKMGEGHHLLCGQFASLLTEDFISAIKTYQLCDFKGTKADQPSELFEFLLRAELPLTIINCLQYNVHIRILSNKTLAHLCGEVSCEHPLETI